MTAPSKGKVESDVGYVKGNALEGRQFTSLGAQNEHLAHWEATVADTRIHGTTRRQVKQVFEEIERAALTPLPNERFPFFHEETRVVHRDGHVEVAKAYYELPPEYLGRTVWVRWDARLVRIFDQRLRPIIAHARVEPGRFTDPKLLHPHKVSAVERGAGAPCFIAPLSSARTPTDGRRRCSTHAASQASASSSVFTPSRSGIPRA